MPKNILINLTDQQLGSVLALVRDAAATARHNNVKYAKRQRHSTAERWLAIAVHWEAIEVAIEAAALEV